MMTRKTALALIMGSSFFLGGTTAVVAADGAAISKDKCERCHGADGNSDNDQVPNIAGFSTTYFVGTMESYQNKDRPGKKFKIGDDPETDMNAIAAELTPEELTALGNYFAGQTFKPHTQEVDSGLVKKGKKLYRRKKCKTCHTANGGDPADDAGILAGQWKAYLQSQFEQFKNGKRTQPKKMKKRFDRVKMEDLPALVEFFASQTEVVPNSE